VGVTWPPPSLRKTNTASIVRYGVYKKSCGSLILYWVGAAVSVDVTLSIQPFLECLYSWNWPVRKKRIPPFICKLIEGLPEIKKSSEKEKL
jgi:hypothetical protein